MGALLGLVRPSGPWCFGVAKGTFWRSAAPAAAAGLTAPAAAAAVAAAAAIAAAAAAAPFGRISECRFSVLFLGFQKQR